MRVLITGGTSGMGQQLAMQLSELGHDVDVFGGMNQVKGMNLVALSRGRIQYYPVDLGNIGDVKRVAAEYMAEHEALDYLVLNAGVYPDKQGADHLGVDKAFVVNYLHRFMLALLLRPLLLSAAAPRVLINGCSRLGGLNKDDQGFARMYSAQQGMSEALKANALLAFWLNSPCGYGIDVDGFHPGFVNSGFIRQEGRLKPLLAKWFARSPRQVAGMMCQLLTEPQLSSGGRYIHGLKDAGYHHSITGRQQDFAWLWQQSLQLTNMIQPYWAKGLWAEGPDLL